MSNFPDTSKIDELWEIASDSFEEAFFERLTTREVARHKIHIVSSGVTGNPEGAGTSYYDLSIHVAKYFRKGWGSGILPKVQIAALEAANRTGFVEMSETADWEDMGSFGYVHIEFSVS